jgi:hypothetical protein
MGLTKFSSVRHDEISKRAYELFKQRGGTNGHDCDDWFQTERELKSKVSHTAAMLIKMQPYTFFAMRHFPYIT